MGKPATKAKNKYNAENYDRISLFVPLGMKKEYKKRAEAVGKSLNQYIIDCIEGIRHPHISDTGDSGKSNENDDGT